MPPSGGAQTRFVADAMLGSLARKLRAFGFDTTYYGSGDDKGIIGIATRSGRIILTADRSLASIATKRNLNVVLLIGKNDSERVKTLAKAARISGYSLRRGDSLCSICSGKLQKIQRHDVTGLVPPSVQSKHRFFFRCRSCGKVYWRGSHWKKLRSIEGRLKPTRNDLVH